MTAFMLLQLKDRLPVVTVECGKVHIEDGAFTVADDKQETIESIPVASISCIMLQPGSSISHAAVCLAAKHNCLLLWVGDAGVRLYASGAATHNGEKIIHQAILFFRKRYRLKLARKLFQMRFGGSLPVVASIEELRGIEVEERLLCIKVIAAAYGINWQRRTNNPSSVWSDQDLINRSLNVATSSLYGICEAAILISGYSPSIGFIHTGNDRSFVFDIADIFKFKTVVPLAFEIVANNQDSRAQQIERLTRLACKDLLGQQRLMEKLVPTIEQMLR